MKMVPKFLLKLFVAVTKFWRRNSVLSSAHFFFVYIFLFSSCLYLPLFCSAKENKLEIASDAGRFFLPLSAVALIIAHKDYDGAEQFAASFGTSAVFAEGIKYITHERRPNGDCCESFPSGHAVWTFSSATFIQRRYGWYWGIPAYALATAVSVARVATKHHYVQDIIGGAILGGGIATIITRHPYTKKSLILVPVAGKKTIGAAASYRW